MKDIYIASIVSLTLVLAAAPNVALAQAPSAEHDGPRPIRLEVDPDAIGERALGLEKMLQEQLAPVFEDNGVELVGPERSDAPRVRVRIGGKFKEVELFDYQLNFELVEGDQVVTLIEPVPCAACYDDVIVPTIAQQVPALVEAVANASAAEPEGPSTGGDGDGGEGDGDTSEPPPSPIGPLGGVGIGVAALGLGAVVWGAVDLSRGRVDDDPPGSDLATRQTWTDYGPRGALLLGVGIGGVVVGGAMLAVDVVIRAKKRKNAKKRSGALIPILTPRSAGLGWVQRF